MTDRIKNKYKFKWIIKLPRMNDSGNKQKVMLVIRSRERFFKYTDMTN